VAIASSLDKGELFTSSKSTNGTNFMGYCDFNWDRVLHGLPYCDFNWDQVLHGLPYCDFIRDQVLIVISIGTEFFVGYHGFNCEM